MLGFSIGTAMAEVVVVVSAQNPVQALSKTQVADIFLGRSKRFPDGSNAVPIDQPEAAAAHDDFYGKFLERSPAQMKAYWSKIIFTGRGQPPREISADELKKFLSRNPNAIGYLDSSALDDSVRAVKISP